MDFVPDYYNDLSVKLRKEECTSKGMCDVKQMREYEGNASGDEVSPHLGDFRNFIVIL